MSLRTSWDLMKGTYPVAKRLTTDAVSTDGRANCSPERYDRMSEVARAVLVTAETNDAQV